MTKECSKCSKPSVTFIRYNGTHLCSEHFIQYVEKRVKKDMKKFGKTLNNCHFGIAVSGGKDSIVTLQLMYDIFHTRPNIQFSVLTVDEGIEGYRGESIPVVQRLCSHLDVEHHIISFQKIIGKTMDDIAKQKDELGECSYCGVFRRLCLNSTAKDLGIDKLVTGHNLDDMAQSILMNFVNSDLQKLARLGPHQKIQPGLVPRMMPLRTIPEKEIMIYAILRNLEFHNGECPYSVRALRGEFRDIINNLEVKNPGTRHGILQSYETIKDLLIKKFPPVDLQKCSICGEPTSQKQCKTCQLKKRIM